MATALTYSLIATGISLTAVTAIDSFLPKGSFEIPVKVARYYPILNEQELNYEVRVSGMLSPQNLTVQKTCGDPSSNRKIKPNQVLLAHHYNYYGKGVYEVVCIN